MNHRLIRCLSIALLALLSGCSILSGSGPTRSAIMDGGSTDATGAKLGSYDLVDLRADTIAPYVLVKAVSKDGATSDGYVGNMRVMPGDVLRILVADSMETGLFAPLAAGGTVFEAVRVAADGSKWNFLPFRPGLVGGHCIGVDPYYLTHKAQAIGYHPEIILAGRRLNDSMGGYVVSQLVKAMAKRRIHVEGARVLLMGLTFKENCPDLRNTRVVDIVRELGEYHVDVDVYDPWVDPAEAEHEYGITPVAKPAAGAYDAIILAVSHHQFVEMGAEAIRKFGKAEHILYDLKYVLAPEQADLRL
ncbi:UDP binding domain-containing protein [Bordetella pertussis]|uniref:UDP binding domain-containing protein n=1 Tax=Bordetella pertussis TaxID=520 RepID=UPI00097D0B66|nr:UDP binding domain-containing protein [Bordetella pertussis]